MSEVRDFIRKLDEEETIRLDPQTNEDREIVKNLRESIADFKTPLGPVPHLSVIDSCIW